MFRPLCIAVATFLVSASTHAQTVLTPKWETGDRLKYVIADKYTSKSTIGQRSFELDQSLTLDTTWEVNRISPGGKVELGVSIDRVRYTADGKGAAAIVQGLTFDSNAEAEPKSKPEQGLADALKNYVGPVGSVTIDGRGSMIDFSLSDELSEKLKETGTRELAGFFGDFFTPNGLRHRLTNWLVAFPTEPVSNGKTWNQELPSRAGPKIACIRNYKLVGSILRDGDTFVQINVSPEFKASDDTKLKIGDQKGDGAVYLDNQSHQIREFVLRHEGSMTSYASQSFNIVYSATLLSDVREDQQSNQR